MKKTIYVSFLLFCLAACNNDDKKEAPAAEQGEDVNTAVSFVKAALKGDFKETRQLAMQDSTNLQFLDIWERKYADMKPSDRSQYAAASIHIYGVQKLNDSATVVVYANSFRNDKDTLKVVNESGKWLVDVKYLWRHDMDTTTARNVDAISR